MLLELEERLEELELGLELDGSAPEGEVDEVLEFCASAVAAINEAVIQNREVLTSTFLIIVLLSPFRWFNPLFRLLPAKRTPPDGGQSHVGTGSGQWGQCRPFKRVGESRGRGFPRSFRGSCLAKKEGWLFLALHKCHGSIDQFLHSQTMVLVEVLGDVGGLAELTVNA